MLLKLPQHLTWNKYIGKECEQQYFQDILAFLNTEKKAGKKIYPEERNIFKALECTDFHDIKVVILGQDPYHGENQAHGLSFSVQDNVNVPPSLKNIYKELEKEYGKKKDLNNGNLESWARQGVLLLNSVLTVEAGKPASHSKIGWGKFTDTIIKKISAEKSGIVFLLWGAFAIKKQELIDREKHLLLTSPHPSPFSAYKGFLGNDHFLQCNDYLEKQNTTPINWYI